MNVPVVTWLFALGLALAASPVHAASPPNDPHFSETGSWGQEFDDQWALKQTRVHADIAPAEPGAEIVVAIIDTGLDYKHEDLAADRLWHNEQEKANGRDDDGNGFKDDLIGWNFVDNSNNPWDLSGHGTHIAGVIAACTNNGIGIAAVNPNARIMPLKVANFIGQAKSTSVAAAIYYAVDHGARIINLSLGGELVTELEKEAARYAQTRDVLIIVAAGNKGTATDRHGYAGLPGVLLAGASDHTGGRAGFSNFGGELALLAPGVEVLSLRAQDTDFIALSDPIDYPDEAAVVGTDKNYYRATGTSFAAALASGVASRLLSLRPDLSHAELKQIMVQSAADVAPPGIDQLSGYGELDYVAALSTEAGRYVHARFDTARLSLEDARLWVELTGTAAAAQFAGAEVHMRAQPGSIPVAEPAEQDKRKRRKKTRRAKKKRDQQEAKPNHYAWQPLQTLSTPVEANTLGRFEVDQLIRLAGGSTIWELRLRVTDTQGGAREATMNLSLPQPEQPVPESPDAR